MITFEKLELVKEIITLLVVYLLDYNYFNEYCKMIAIDLSKQQALDADSKSTQQINFTRNLDRGRNAYGEIVNDNTMFFIIKEVKETILDLPQGTVKVL